jgi:hypothetical protein
VRLQVQISEELPPAQVTDTLLAMKALVLKNEQFLTDAKGRRVGVLLDVKTYEHLREAEEELADIRAYDVARPKAAADLKAGRFSSLSEYRAKRGSKHR